MKEADILALVRQMVAGYQSHGADFPSINRALLNIKRIVYANARKRQIEAHSQMQLATDNKNTSLDTLRELMKSCLKKSQIDAAANPEKLALIGWGRRAILQPVEPPGQPRELNCLTQAKASILLEWNHPAGGGAVRNYIVEKRELLQDNVLDSWRLVGTALNTTICLTCQRQAVQLEYRIKAVNKAGESIPSNTAAVVL